MPSIGSFIAETGFVHRRSIPAVRGDTPARLFLFRRLAEVLDKCGGTGIKVLDIGCGDGRPWKANRSLLAAYAPILTGVDRDETAVRRFTDEFHAPGVRCDVANLRESLSGVTFDVAVSFNCLQYVHRLDAVFAGVRSVLTPGEAFLIVLGNPASRFWRELDFGSLQSQVGWWVTADRGFRRYGARSFARAANRAGFDVVEFRHLTTARAKRLLNEMGETTVRDETVSEFLAAEIQAGASGRARPRDFVEMFVECRAR